MRSYRVIQTFLFAIVLLTGLSAIAQSGSNSSGGHESYTPTSEGSAGESPATSTNNNTNTGEESSEGATSVSGGTPQCSNAAKNAKRACDGIYYSQMVAPVLQAFMSAQGSGDMKSACQAAKNYNTLSTAANAGFGVACTTYIRRCKNECKNTTAQPWEDYPENYANHYQCESDEFKSYLAYAQAGQSAVALAGSQQCEKIASGVDDYNSCEGEFAKLNPSCEAYCEASENANSPLCVAQNDDICSDPVQAASNTECICRANPTLPECVGDGGAITIEDPKLADGDPEFDDLIDPDDIGEGGFNGVGDLQDTPQNIAGGGSGGGGSAGLGSGGSGGAPLGGGGSGGEGADPYDTDILKGVSGGGGGGGAFGNSGGGYASGSGGKQGSRGVASSGKFKGFDLKKFLPGQKKAQKRNLAGKIESASEIAGANDRSNWERISTKFRQKKSYLLK